MSMIDLLEEQQRNATRFTGIATAKVTNNKDPDGLGRVKLKYEWRNADEETDWVRLMTFMGGNETGAFFLPEVDDEVVVAFQNGDIDSPIVLGSLWSQNVVPPETNSDGENNLRLIKSRSEHKLIFDDTDGSEKITIIDKEDNSIEIDTSNKTITITSMQNMNLLAEDGKITISAKEIEVKSSEKTSMEAGSDYEVKASSGKVSVDSSELELKAAAAGKLEASGNLDVKSSAILTVKGSMVKIN